MKIKSKKIYETFPGTEKNDNLLYVKYIDTYHNIEFTKDNFIRFKDLKIPPFSSIERAGRTIRNKYKYLDKLEQEKRQFAAEEYKEYARRRKN